MNPFKRDLTMRRIRPDGSKVSKHNYARRLRAHFKAVK